jgi:hypothetical protein
VIIKMKNSNYTSSTMVLCSLCLMLLSTSGCRENKPLTGTAENRPADSGMAGGIMKPLEPQGSFNEVMSLLDEGGGVLLYLGTDQLYAKLAEKTDELQSIIQKMNPDGSNDEGKAEMEKFFGIAGEALKRSGISEISGFGLSGAEIEDGLHRSRVVLHHYPDKGDGYAWKFLGGKPHAPIGLDLMPANTILASGQDFDLAAIWNALSQEAEKLGKEEFSAALAALPKEFKKATQLEFDDFLNSLAGHYGFALTLDEESKITFPGDDGENLEFPRPDLLIFAKVKDRSLFDRLAEQSKAIPGTVVTNQNGVDQVQFPAVYPPMPTLKPVLAFDGEQILICGSPEMLAASMAVKAGKEPGLASDEQFKKLSALSPVEGNGFSYYSRRIETTASELQKTLMKTVPPEARAIQDLMDKMGTPGDSFGVFSNTDQGWIWTGVGTEDNSGMFLATSVIVPTSIFAGMLVPALSDAKSKATRIKCVNQLRQVSLGLKIFASDHDDHYPFGLKKVEGGVLETTKQDRRGDDSDPFEFLMLLQDELGTPAILTCPEHEGVQAVRSWREFKRDLISYKFRSGDTVDETQPDEVLLWCPFHHNVALVDGSVVQLTEKDTKARKSGSWQPQVEPAQ